MPLKKLAHTLALASLANELANLRGKARRVTTHLLRNVIMLKDYG